VAVFAGAQSATSTATVPRLIRVHGTVTGEAGKPLTGNIGLTFTLYKDDNSQDVVWQETQTVQLDSTGHFGALLGASSEAGVPLDIFSAGEARWLGIRPDGQAEQTRMLFLSVPYALKAADAETLGGKPASAFALAGSQFAQTGSQIGGVNSLVGAHLDGTLGNAPQTACSTITSDGTATVNQLAKFTTACNIQNSAIFESGGNVGIGNSSPAGMLDVTGTAFVRGALTSLGGIVIAPTGTATQSQGFISNPFDIEASLYNTTLGRAANYIWRWQAEPVGNDSASTSSTLNLLFGVPGNVSETGISVNNLGIISFATGQTFPGAGTGTVTSVATGAGLTGGPITKSGTISVPNAGITNAMLANSSVTVQAGSGLSGGGTIALGGTITLTNSSPGLGGTVTSVGSGTGLKGGPITTSGTLTLDTSFTDARYLVLTGGTLTGGLSGTTGAFSGAISAAGALMPGTGTATASKGFVSNPFDLQASSFSSKTSAAVLQDFRWEAEPTGNNTANPSGSLNLLFGSNGATPAETGFSIAANGLVSFATGQTFPGTGSGTVTSVGTGAGLTGGPITGSGTISIPSAGVTNTMIANPSVTVQAGSGLSGGGTVALGGTITLTNSAPGLGGTVTSVGSGTGLKGGPITSSGTLTLDTGFTDARYLQITGGSLTGGLTGTTAAFTGALGATTGTFSGAVTAAGDVLPGTGTATASKGFSSNPFDLQASSFSSKTSTAVAQDFRWEAEPTGNNTANPSGSLNLLFGSNGTAPAETGFSIAANGLVSFAAGQTFPGTGSGTVTSVGTGAGLTGGPITGSGTISIPAAGVTNTMLANPSVTVQAGSGLSGGGTVALGGTITLTNTAPSLGGTVTSVGSGTGLKGGPITTSGSLSLDTTFTDARYLQITGGTLSGGLNGTTAAFSGALGAAAGTFSGLVTSAGSLLPGTGTATASKGFVSNPFDIQASSFSSKTSTAVTQDFRWEAEPAGNNTANPSGTLNLLFGSNGTVPVETGLSIASNGFINFIPSQTFGIGGGGGGTVTQVNTGAGLTGGPITTSGTISIPSAGVVNSMLANPSVTVQAGSGLSGGGTVALGGTITLTNTAPGLGGTVTSVGSGTGLTGGPITSSGSLSLDTTFTDSRYLQLTGGTLSGALTGTSAAFSAGLTSTTGTFSSTVSAAGASLPTTGTATASQGYNSNPLDWMASSFNSTTSSDVTQDFRWQAEPTGNASSSPSATLNLLFGSNGTAPSETGLSIASNGLITFAPGQTFNGGGGGGSGTVTQVNTGAGLTGGPITTSGTISIPAAGVVNGMLANPSITLQAGAGLSGGGTVALGGTVTLASNLSGTTDGIAYFSSPTNVVSTPAPTNGQILIGSTGSAPVLGTLTAGSNINITNSAGAVTISATGGSAATLPFFVTGSQHTGGTLTGTKNVVKLWGFLLPYNVTTTKVTYDITTADNTANNYDIGIYDYSGNLLANIGPTPGTTFSPAKAFETLAWSQGSVSLGAGRYYLAVTTNCATTCAKFAATTNFMSFAINASAGATVGGALTSIVTPPADNWSSSDQPTMVIQ
jgi:hypothetical protein